jgi:hypothetical protein
MVSRYFQKVRFFRSFFRYRGEKYLMLTPDLAIQLYPDTGNRDGKHYRDGKNYNK